MPPEAFFKPIYLDLEKKVLEFAENLLELQLEEYETTIEDDVELINTPKSHRHYFAVFNN